MVAIGCFWVQGVIVCPVSMVLLVQECSLVQVFSGARVFSGASGPDWCLADIPPIPLLIANFNCTVRASPIRFSQCESIHTTVVYQFGNTNGMSTILKFVPDCGGTVHGHFELTLFTSRE